MLPTGEFTVAVSPNLPWFLMSGRIMFLSGYYFGIIFFTSVLFTIVHVTFLRALFALDD
jgi:hypothetical protein